MSNDKESTTKIESVGFLCEDILSFLSGHNNISNVAKFWNGFEGWMKFEIVTHLMNEYKFEPWEGDEYGAIGVEYKAVGASEEGASNGKKQYSKRVDFWISEDRDSHKYYCVELKVVFNNVNRGKMRGYWISDYLGMLDIQDENAIGFASIAAFVGFDNDGEYENMIEAAKAQLGCTRYGWLEPQKMAERPDKGESVRFAAIYGNR